MKKIFELQMFQSNKVIKVVLGKEDLSPKDILMMGEALSELSKKDEDVKQLIKDTAVNIMIDELSEKSGVNPEVLKNDDEQLEKAVFEYRFPKIGEDDDS